MEAKFKRIQCIDRALDILDAVSNGKCRTISEIGACVGLNQATAYNIVKTLDARGFICCPEGVYKLGPKLGLLASNWSLADSLPLLTRPILEEVIAKTGEPVCVTVMNGLQAEIINLMQGIRQVSVQFLHRTWNYPLNLATGRLLVALGKESEWPLHIKRQLQCELKNKAECDWDSQRWQSELEKLRIQDFVILKIAPETEAEEIGAVAVPIRNASGIVVGVIGSSCPLNRATTEHLKAMKDAITVAIASNPL